jgi:flagellar basal-body rod protein FlgG
MPDGTDGFTRDGSLSLSADGQLVTAKGYVVAPGIAIPQGALSVAINAIGQVQATISGQTDPQTLGQIELARFPNEGGLQAMGDNLFTETAASGAPLTGLPGSPGFGTLQQGFLETSNVNAVQEITNLITAQRAYEMNSKVITTADQMLDVTSRMS